MGDSRAPAAAMTIQSHCDQRRGARWMVMIQKFSLRENLALSHRR
jgi:hypothetical protein